jgi:hypothetical protein
MARNPEDYKEVMPVGMEDAIIAVHQAITVAFLFRSPLAILAIMAISTPIIEKAARK